MKGVGEGGGIENEIDSYSGVSMRSMFYVSLRVGSCFVCVCVCALLCACVCVCVRACVCVCVLAMAVCLLRLCVHFLG